MNWEDFERIKEGTRNFDLLTKCIEEAAKLFSHQELDEITLEQVYVYMNMRVEDLIEEGKFETQIITLDNRVAYFDKIAVRVRPGSNDIEIAPVYTYKEDEE